MKIKDKIVYFLLAGVCPLALLVSICVSVYWSYVVPITLCNFLWFLGELLAFSGLAVTILVLLKLTHDRFERLQQDERTREARERESRERWEREAREAEDTMIRAARTGEIERMRMVLQTDEITRMMEIGRLVNQNSRGNFIPDPAPQIIPMTIMAQKSRDSQQSTAVITPVSDPISKKATNAILELEISD